MKCLERNKVPFYYALYQGKLPVEDEYGNLTGEFEVIYGLPERYEANISPAVGEARTQQFGENLEYDKVIAMANTAPPIDEYSVLWVDTLPIFNENGGTDTPHDYVVRKVAKSLNFTLLAIKRVDVS